MKFMRVPEEEVMDRGYPADAVEYYFHCPGCGCNHWVRVKGDRPCWTWNGDIDKPTVNPSLLVHYGPNRSQVCHSFIRDGQIQFLSDCTHHLAGQTVEIPEWE